MPLPFASPLLPMLAKRVSAIPDGDAWCFEPKWDGFRVLVFRDGDELLLQSRDGKPLNRYFPELLVALRPALPPGCVLDGEIVIAMGHALDFDALQQRVHPAASRIQLLSSRTPASIVFFDLLCVGERDVRAAPFRERRALLEQLLAGLTPPLHLTPATQDAGLARDWFGRFEGAGLDGVVAKDLNSPYQPNKRVMLKVKHERDCDCVVAGFRWYKQGEHTSVGSLLLGLYDDAGSLQHVGTCASFTKEKREELVALLTPYRPAAGEAHPWNLPGNPAGNPAGGALANREQAAGQPPQPGSATGPDQPGEVAQAVSERVPGARSRWSQGKDLSWELLRPELVAEVAYEHMQGSRFRHLAHFRRWRTDKPPAECTYAQLEVVPPEELTSLFAGGR